MANFLENPNVQYNAPVQTAPLAALAAVGMQKQVLYNEGVERIQGQIDQTAALPVSRDVDKAYLNQSLANLGTELKKLSTADFSQMQIQNSTAGMTSKISKDKNIQAAVYSTIHDQSNQTLMDEDRKKGTLTPDNEFYYQKQRQEYLNSTDLGRQFNGKYVPNFDILKFAKENFDAVKPDGYNMEQIFATNADGSIQVDKSGNPVYSPLMFTLSREGRFPEKVRETIAQIFSDPRVSQQLAITGQYNYRAYEGQSLVDLVDRKKISSLASANERMAQLQLDKNTGKDVSKEMLTLQNIINNKNTYYDQYKSIALSNPDAIRGALYSDDVSEKYSTMFGYIKEEKKTVENPGWNQNFKMMKEKNDQFNKDREFRFQQDKFKSEERWRGLDYEQKERLAKEKNKVTIDNKVEKDFEPGNFNAKGAVEEQVQSAVENFSNTSDSFIYDTMFANNPTNRATYDRLMKQSDNIGQPEKVKKIILNTLAKQNNNEDPISFRARWADKAATQYNLNASESTPQMRDAYQATILAKRQMEEITSMQKIANDAASLEIEKKYGKNSILKNVQPIKGKFNGRDLTISKEDIYDLAVVAKSKGSVFNSDIKKAAVLAANRLAAKGIGGDVIDEMLNQKENEMITDPLFESNTSPNINFSSIFKVIKKIDTEQFSDEMDIQNKVYSNTFHLQPRLKMNIMPTKAEEIKAQKENIARLATTYKENNQNIASDFKTFYENMQKDGGVFEAHIIPSNKGGEPMVSISLGGPNVESGHMVITQEEAKSLNIDTDKLYEPKETTNLKSKISIRGGQSSYGDPTKIDTYASGDVALDVHAGDFPSLTNSKYNVKVNYVYSMGKYFPYVFVSDGVRPPVLQQLEGNSNLQESITGLKTVITPGMAEIALSKNPRK